jgi:hypothetical protein
MATRGGGGTKPRDLVVRFLSDVAGFVKGADDVADTLDATARDAEKSSDKIARDYDAAAEKMERSTDEFTRDLAASYRAAATRVRSENDKIQRDTTETFRETGREAGNELAQNLGESISSGDVSGLVSGTVGGLAATLGTGGPIGLALAGLATAAVGVFQQMRAAADAAAAAADAAFQQLREGADDQAKLEQVLTDRFGSVVAGMEQVSRYSETTGISTERIYDALIKGGPAAERIASYADKMSGSLIDAEGSLGPTRSLLRDMADDLRDRADAVERGSKAEQEWNRYLGLNTRELRKQADYYSARGSAYAPGGSTYRQQVPYDRGVRE